jgi:hypothetical protein
MGLPETIVKGLMPFPDGVPTAAPPERVPPAVFNSVKVRSAKLPRATGPKLTGPVGFTEKSARACALATVEQGL